MLQAIREIYTVECGEIRVQIPKIFWGQEVEIIILPVPVKTTQDRPKISLRGCLQQYANPALISMEKEALQDTMMDKHAHR